MAAQRRSLVACLAFAFFIVAAAPLGAAGFDAFLARFPELKAPAALGPETAARTGNSLIPIEEFEAFVLVPGHALASARPGLRDLDGWPARILERRSYEGHPRESEDYRLTFQAIGRWKAGDRPLIALRCGANRDWEDGGEVWTESFLLSFEPSGKLIDGVRFAWTNSYPPPIVSGGSPNLGTASLAIDSRGRIVALDSYGLDGIDGEIWSWELGLSPLGYFSEGPQKRRFLLSRIYAEASQPPGRLYVYETEARERGDPFFLSWQKDGVDVRAETTEAAAIPGSFTAREAAGRELAASFSADGKSVELTDPKGKPRALAIEYGPGAAGEPTRMRGVMPVGDHYDNRSATWTYLFAEASLPAAPTDEKMTFKARSFVLGTTADGGMGSTDDVAALGTFMDEGQEYTRYFSNSQTVARTLVREFRVDGRSGSVTLPAGTRMGDYGDNGRWWAVPPAETTVPLPGQKVKAPAGSRLYFYPGDGFRGAAFAKPVPARVGSTEASIWEVDLNSAVKPGFSEIALAAPFAATIAGKKLSLEDRLYFDDMGVLKSGRLTADAEFAVGGKTFSFRGGFDPERPDSGLVGFYPDGKLLSGTLAKGAQIETAKSSIGMVAGDVLTFGKDGRLQTVTPVGMTSVTADGKKTAAKVVAISLSPDGGVSILSSQADFSSSKGKIVVAALAAACNDTRVRMRSEPNLEAPTLGYLNKGDRLIVLDKSSRQMQIEDANEYWYRVRRVSDGLTGWSYGQFLKLD